MRHNLSRPLITAGIASALLLGSAIARAESVTPPKTTWKDTAVSQMAVDAGQSLIAHLQAADALLASGYTGPAGAQLLDSSEIADSLERLVQRRTVAQASNGARGMVLYMPPGTERGDLLAVYPNIHAMRHSQAGLTPMATAIAMRAEHHSGVSYQQLGPVYLPVQAIDDDIAMAQAQSFGSYRGNMAAQHAIEKALNTLTAAAPNKPTHHI